MAKKKARVGGSGDVSPVLIVYRSGLACSKPSAPPSVLMTQPAPPPRVSPVPVVSLRVGPLSYGQIATHAPPSPPQTRLIWLAWEEL